MKSTVYYDIVALLHSGQRQAAIELFERERELLSEQECNECLGNLHFYAKEYQAAIPYYEAAIEGGDGYDVARYHYLIGVQLEQQGQLSDAFERYQAAIEIEPTFVDSFIELGGLLCKVNDYRGAYQCYDDAIRLDPDDLALHQNLVQVLTCLVEAEPLAYRDALSVAQGKLSDAEKRLPKPDEKRIW